MSQEKELVAQEFANEVVQTSTQYTGKDTRYTFSIITIVTIVQIIIQIFKLFQSMGYTTSDVTQLFRNPDGPLRSRISAIVRKKLGYIKYWQIGKQLEDSILRTGQSLNSQQVSTLLE